MEADEVKRYFTRIPKINPDRDAEVVLYKDFKRLATENQMLKGHITFLVEKLLSSKVGITDSRLEHGSGTRAN
jgi:hypothetical protein